LAKGELAVATRQRTVSHFFFHRRIFNQNNITVVRHSPYYSVSPIVDKTERPPFDAIEVIEAESQAVLNTLTEHDFQVKFKKWQKVWVRFILAKRDYFDGECGQ
jgi:hypothetical protein